MWQDIAWAARKAVDVPTTDVGVGIVGSIFSLSRSRSHSLWIGIKQTYSSAEMPLWVDYGGIIRPSGSFCGVSSHLAGQKDNSNFREHYSGKTARS